MNNETTYRCRNQHLSCEQLKLAATWIFLLICKRNEARFIKKIERLGKILKRVNAMPETCELHQRLTGFYMRNRASLWFDLLNALDQGADDHCRDTRFKINFLTKILGADPWKVDLENGIIARSPFPHDRWELRPETRKVYLPGNRTIVCE